MNVDRVPSLSKLDVVAERPDVRRDLHVFVHYVRDRQVKRGHRDNLINKTDARRLARLLSDPEAEAEVAEVGSSVWLGLIDELAYRLGLVRYDTEGVYEGYTSREPCFPDNYIRFDSEAYDKLTSMSLAQQEKHLLDCLLHGNQGGASEFYHPIVFGRLDGFSTRGSATGVMPTIDFSSVRLRRALESARKPGMDRRSLLHRNPPATSRGASDAICGGRPP